jgi:enamine deaminase RidA (YjgF/YER057c/UK114 family)
VTFEAFREAGGLLCVAGMVGREADGTVAMGLARQTTLSLERAERALADLQLDRRAICSIRISLVDVTRWPEVRDIVVQWFGGTVPPCTVVGVTGLVDPAMEIEIETLAAR